MVGEVIVVSVAVSSVAVSLAVCSVVPRVTGVARTGVTLGKPVTVVTVAIISNAVIVAIIRIFIIVISNTLAHNIFNDIVSKFGADQIKKFALLHKRQSAYNL